MSAIFKLFTLIVFAGGVLTVILNVVYHSILFMDRTILAFFLGFTLFINMTKETSRLTFIVTLLLFLTMFFSYANFGSMYQTERLATWTVLFFLYGLIQQTIEHRS